MICPKWILFDARLRHPYKVNLGVTRLMYCEQGATDVQSLLDALTVYFSIDKKIE